MKTSEDHCLLSNNAVVEWYQNLRQNGALFVDGKQEEGIAKLQQLARQIARKQTSPATQTGGFLSRWLGENKNTADDFSGLYLHGGAGRGKSFLMDGFYLQLRATNKLRAHFHQFMRHFHEDIKNVDKNVKDPLLSVADDLSAKFSVICFDEFHVSDITDAMILGRLLQRMFDNGTLFVMTSNYAPSQLYPNGLGRDRFLPTIALLEKKLEVFTFDGDEDYRLRHMAQRQSFLLEPQGCRQRLQNMFDALACGIALPPQIKINKRIIQAVARSSDIIWFSFEQLCAATLGQRDYLNLAERYAAIVLSETPALGNNASPEASRRFTWLVDILYDQRVILIMSAEVELEKLYEDNEGGESGRTISRLIEMQSSDYWGESLLSPPVDS